MDLRALVLSPAAHASALWACSQQLCAVQGSLPSEWFSSGAFPELRALVLSYGPLDTPDLRAPKHGAIAGQLPDVGGGALRNLQVMHPPVPVVTLRLG